MTDADLDLALLQLKGEVTARGATKRTSEVPEADREKFGSCLDFGCEDAINVFKNIGVKRFYQNM